jgi:hypothetical protein
MNQLAPCVHALAEHTCGLYVCAWLGVVAGTSLHEWLGAEKCARKHLLVAYIAHCVPACVLARCFFSCEPLRSAAGTLLLLVLLVLLQVGTDFPTWVR